MWSLLPLRAQAKSAPTVHCSAPSDDANFDTREMTRNDRPSRVEKNHGIISGRYELRRQ
jgi:hypothetical protein